MLRYHQAKPVLCPAQTFKLTRSGVKSGHIKLTIGPVPKYNQGCVRRVAKWFSASNFTLDSGLFYIFHKKIISSMLDRNKKGVRVRVLVYREHLMGEKQEKNQMYLEQLKQQGVHVRYVEHSSSQELANRMILLDASDPENRPAACGNAPCVIFGDQPEILPQSDQAKHDQNYIRYRNDPADTDIWKKMFELMWTNSSEFNSTY